MKPRHTWEEAVVRWLLETKHKATHEADKRMLRWLDPYLGGRTLDEIDRTLVDRIKFEREKVASGATANRYLALIRAILRRASHDWEWLDKVPRVKLFKEPEGRVRALTHEEFARLIRELPEHLADMAVFSVVTGLRQANVKHLSWTQVDLERHHAWIPASQHKNRKAHAVPLNETALTVLRKQLGKYPTRVFTFRGQPIEQIGTKAWRAALQRAGIDDFRWHDLRHTFATWTVKPERPRMNCNGSAGGGPARWWSVMRTWRLRLCSTQLRVSMRLATGWRRQLATFWLHRKDQRPRHLA